MSWNLSNNKVHQRAFDHVKATIARKVVLAYPDYSEVFEIYTDASSKQLGAVITQKNRPIAFFSRKLTAAQRKYSVTEIELLAIVETLKKPMCDIWKAKVFSVIFCQLQMTVSIVECHIFQVCTFYLFTLKNYPTTTTTLHLPQHDPHILPCPPIPKPTSVCREVCRSSR